MISWNKILTLSSSNDNMPYPKVFKTNAEWESLLSPEVYRVTRLHGTERPHSGEYTHVSAAKNFFLIALTNLILVRDGLVLLNQQMIPALLINRIILLE